MSVLIVFAQIWEYENYRGADQALAEEREHFLQHSLLLFEIRTHLGTARNAEHTFLSSIKNQSTAEERYSESIDAITDRVELLAQLPVREDAVLRDRLQALGVSLSRYQDSVREIAGYHDSVDSPKSALLIHEIFWTLQSREEALFETLDASEVRDEMHEIELLSRDFVILLNLQHLDRLQALLGELTVRTPEQRDALEAYQAVVAQMLRDLVGLKLQKASSQLEYERASRELEGAEVVLASRRALCSERLRLLRQHHQWTQRILLVLLILSLALCLYVQGHARRALQRRIQALSRVMGSFETGSPPDLIHTEDIDSTPISQLSSQFVQLARQVNRQFEALKAAQQELVQREKHATALEERARSAVLLAERESWFRTIFESAHDMMVIADSGGIIVDINRVGQALLGHPKAALVGRHLSGLFTADCVDKVQRSIVSRSGEHIEVITSRDGAFDSTISLSIAEVFISERPFLHAIGHDISMLKRATREHQRLERRLRMAQQFELLGTLAGGIAHDVNNMLTPILGCADLLEDVTRDAPEAEELRQDILTSAQQAARLVRRILDFSRSTSQDKQPYSVRDSLQQLTRLIERNLPRNISFEASLLEEHVTVLGSVTDLQQILSNLSSNAQDAMSAGGRLSIAVSSLEYADAPAEVHHELKPGPLVRLSVSDTGHGMSPAVMERVFEPYYSTKPITLGTGLGLATVFGIVRRLEGCIFISSTLDVGTTVTIYIPALAERLSARLPAPSPTSPSPQPQKVIVVDDEPLNVRMLERMLRQLGIAVTGFVSSPHALAYIQEHHLEYDVIISDLTMPDLTGVELLCALRRLDRALPVIIYTGYGDQRNLEAIEAAGASLVLQKPLNRRTLLSGLQRVMVAR